MAFALVFRRLPQLQSFEMGLESKNGTGSSRWYLSGDRFRRKRVLTRCLSKNPRNFFICSGKKNSRREKMIRETFQVEFLTLFYFSNGKKTAKDRQRTWLSGIERDKNQREMWVCLTCPIVLLMLKSFIRNVFFRGQSSQYQRWRNGAVYSGGEMRMCKSNRSVVGYRLFICGLCIYYI